VGLPAITVYGVGDIEQQLRQAGKGYVLGISSAHVFQSWGQSGDPSPARPADIAPDAAPVRLEALVGGEPETKGPAAA